MTNEVITSRAPDHQAVSKLLAQCQQIVFSAKPRFSQPDSFRVFHGRGGCYPDLDFLAVDYFKPALLLTIYRAPPATFLGRFCAWLQTEILDGDVNTVLVQRRDQKARDLQIIAGNAAVEQGKFRAQRGELHFALQSDKQNVGYFLDIEPARCWLEKQARDKSVLNLFAYTCSFSVIAMAAGARSVLNMDMSSAALNIGRINHTRNGIATDKVTFLAHDILRSWGKLQRKGPYDIVIVDPPSMQPGSFVAKQDYSKIIKRLPALLCGDGLAVLCLNAPEISCAEFQEMIARCEQPLVFQEALPTSPDFPNVGESNLKMLVYRLETGVVIPPL